MNAWSRRIRTRRIIGIKDSTVWPAGTPRYRCGTRGEPLRGRRSGGTREGRYKNRRGPPAGYNRLSFLRGHQRGYGVAVVPAILGQLPRVAVDVIEAQGVRL